MNPIRYSILLPVYNEAESLPSLMEEIIASMNSLGREPYEIIVIDDGSDDASAAAAIQADEKKQITRVISHVRNFGQSAALLTGIHRARGEIIITLDSDGQNNPDDIGELLDALADDVDVVCGVRVQRNDRLIKRISSRIGNRVRRAIVGDRFSDSGCNFRIMRAAAARQLPSFNGVHRFAPALLEALGYRVIERPVSHRPRMKGVSKYGVRNRAWRGLVDCIAVRWWKKRIIPARRAAENGNGHDE